MICHISILVFSSVNHHYHLLEKYITSSKLVLNASIFQMRDKRVKKLILTIPLVLPRGKNLRPSMHLQQLISAVFFSTYTSGWKECISCNKRNCELLVLGIEGPLPMLGGMVCASCMLYLSDRV